MCIRDRLHAAARSRAAGRRSGLLDHGGLRFAESGLRLYLFRNFLQGCLFCLTLGGILSTLLLEHHADGSVDVLERVPQRRKIGGRVAELGIAEFGERLYLLQQSADGVVHLSLIHIFQQRLRNFRKVVVQPEVYARRQQRYRFNQSLDMRIFAAIRLQQQTRRHLGILFREFRALLAQKRQLAFVRCV